MQYAYLDSVFPKRTAGFGTPNLSNLPSISKPKWGLPKSIERLENAQSPQNIPTPSATGTNGTNGTNGVSGAASISHIDAVNHVLNCTECLQAVKKNVGLAESERQTEEIMDLITYIIFALLLMVLIGTISK